jgi:alpha-L-fucosidase 2
MKLLSCSNVCVAGAVALAQAACLMTGGDAAQAQVINFDVPGGVSGYVNYSGQGAYSDSGHNYWNPVVTSSPYTTPPGTNSDGVTTSLITLTAPYGAGGGGVYTGDPQGANGTPAGLFAPFESDKSSTTEINTLNNVPAGIYNLYLYGDNGDSGDSDRGTTFTVSTASTSATSLSTANLSADADTFVQGVNYVKFTNIVVGTNGVITIAWTANTAATNTINPQTEGIFNGLQLVTISVAQITNLPAANITANSATLSADVLGTGGSTPVVTLFYGTANGGTNAANWADSINLGPTSGSAAQTVTGLSSNTTYYFTAQASNNIGVSWATPSGSFTTTGSTLVQVINFDVPGGIGGINYSGQGAYSDPGHNYWNPIADDGTTAAGTKSDGVTLSPVTLTDASTGSYAPGQGAQGTPAGLESPFVNDSGNGSTITETLNNVPAGTYNLFLYGKNDDAGDANRGTTFAVSVGTTNYGAQSTVNSVTSSFTMGNDYVEFTNIVVGAAGVITFTYKNNAVATNTFNPQNEGNFNGLQLVTLFLSTTLATVTNSSATGIQATSATLGGAVVSTGGYTPTVTIYYGTNNGGTNTAAWANSVSLGFETGAFSQVVNNLSPATAYYFTAAAVNGSGTNWATPSQSFTTIAATLAQITNLPAANITANTATLAADVLSTGGSTTVVTLFYGATDGGTNAANWADSINLGPAIAYAAQTVTGLSSNTTYYFTAQASNNIGVSWASPSGSFTTLVTNPVVNVLPGYNPQRMDLTSNYPTVYSHWVDALCGGNGQEGIMVFGNPLNDTIIFNDRGFNMAASTSSPVRTFNVLTTAELATIRNDCADGSFLNADNMASSEPDWQNGGEGNRHPGYEMLISIPQNGTVTNYSRSCNFETGEISINWTDNLGPWVRTAFVSRQDNVTVQYLPAPPAGTLNCSIQLTTDPGMNFPSGMTFTSLASANFLNMRVNYPSSAGSAGYEGVTRVVPTGGTVSVSGSVLTVSNATSLILLTRTAKYYTNCTAQWNEENLQAQLAALPTDYNTLLNGQIATHGAIYDRVQVNFNASAATRALDNDTLLTMQSNSSTPINALWERIYDAGRYYFLSSSSSNAPPDLFGMWTGDCNASFGGLYNTDANLNVQVAGGNVGDMPEAMAGYFAMNTAWQPGEQTSASNLLGCRGMIGVGNSPGTNDGVGGGLIASISTYYPYQYATGEEGWLLYHFWEYYQITGDTNFLLNSVYPLFQDMGNFYQDFLMTPNVTDTNGNYILAGSVSPENQPSNLAVSLVNNSTFDIAGAKFCLSTLIQICNILGLQQGPSGGVATWTGILSKLPPYLVGEPNNPDGALCEWSWPGLDDQYNHRHSSHLITVWPLREITPEATPGLFSAAAIAMAKRDAYDYENAGHGWDHSALIAANLKNATAVNHKIMYLLQNGFYYSTLASSHYNGNSVFCTDTCHAMAGIMMEMLVSSSPGVVELLPALPQTLTVGGVSEVKCRTQVTVQDLSWDMGAQTVSCTLLSTINQSITLIERSGINTMSISGGTISSSPLGPDARVVQLQAGVGANITIGLGQPDLALNRPVTVSSTASGSSGANAVDGNTNTFWSSANAQSESIYVDLGLVMNLTGAQLVWGSSYGQSYEIQVSTNAVNWTTVFETPTGDGGTERITMAASGRYVQMLGVQSSASGGGYSLAEFQVFGVGSTTSAPLILNAALTTNGNITVSWPTPSASYFLEAATNLTPPITWSPVTNSIVNQNGSNQTTITPAGDATFFVLTSGQP